MPSYVQGTVQVRLLACTTNSIVSFMWKVEKNAEPPRIVGSRMNERMNRSTAEGVVKVAL
jgi:hypothetical protein